MTRLCPVRRVDLEVLLDDDIAFNTAGLVPDADIDVVGVLARSGSIWVLKPRATTDVAVN